VRTERKLAIGVICPADFVKRLPFGGGSGLVENLFPVAPFPMTVFGIGVNGTPVWQPVTLAAGVTFVAIAGFSFPARLPMRLSTLCAYFRHRRRILESGVDLLYVHSPEVALPFLFGRRRLPVIFHQHGSGNPLVRAKFPWARNRLLQRLFDDMLRIIHRRSSWTIAIDPLCLEQARRNGVAEKTSLIMNAVDLCRFRPDAETRRAMRERAGVGAAEVALLFVGRIEEIKRVDRVLDAMKLLRDDERGFRLFLAGDGTMRCRLEEEAAAAGLSSRVTFLGRIPHDELFRYYNMADLLVLPSEMEGAPMVVLESLACGTPVVASAVGGVPHIVRTGVNGFLAAGDPASLAAAIRDGSALGKTREEVAGSVRHLGTERFMEELGAIGARVTEGMARWE
jgi:glycosyltransferase involved in cell wall biosynthesis